MLLKQLSRLKQPWLYTTRNRCKHSLCSSLCSCCPCPENTTKIRHRNATTLGAHVQYIVVEPISSACLARQPIHTNPARQNLRARHLASRSSSSPGETSGTGTQSTSTSSSSSYLSTTYVSCHTGLSLNCFGSRMALPPHLQLREHHTEYSKSHCLGTK